MGEIYTMILTQNVTFECHVNISVVCYLKNVIIIDVVCMFCLPIFQSQGNSQLYLLLVNYAHIYM